MVLEKLLQKLKSRGSKVLVFSQFKIMLDLIGVCPGTGKAAGRGEGAAAMNEDVAWDAFAWFVMYRGSKNSGGDKIDVDKFGSPSSSEVFPAILGVLCAKMCA